MYASIFTFLVGIVTTLSPAAFGQSPAVLVPVRTPTCSPAEATCADFDAIVFVHGIYGGKDTFVNSTTSFNWPVQMPKKIRDRQLDVFQLNYQSELLAWASGSTPSFKYLNESVYIAMKPLRMRQYRSIGFIAHSLGGNVVSTYIHFTKTERSHPASSQHAYVVTLATPVLGSQVADIGGSLKSLLGMSDPLLESLRSNNLFLEMLLEFRKSEGPKRELYACRAINLHVAYEERYLGPFLVVTRDSAAQSVVKLASSPIVGFQLDHSEIAKPTDSSHEVFKWVNQVIDDEFVRLSAWSKAVSSQPNDRQLCIDIPFKPEA